MCLQCARCGDLVKRAMNRPPQEADCRGRMGKGKDCQDPQCAHHMHMKHCGGEFIKVSDLNICTGTGFDDVTVEILYLNI